MTADPRIKKMQEYFQKAPAHTYLKAKPDRITSVAIPLAATGLATFLLFSGLANLYRGTGKEDQ